MRVLSLCDGISNTMVALKNMNIPIDVYYSCEIDKSAIAISKYNHPEIIQLGDLTKLTNEQLDSLGKIDLVVYGSPCQSLSIASASTGKRAECKNGEKITGKSSLFYECLRIQRYINPTYWIVENVKSMTKEAKAEFDKELGVTGVYLDGRMFSAQRRSRWFWSNINFSTPTESEWDTAILIDVLLDQVPEKYYLSEEQQKKIKWNKNNNTSTNTCDTLGYIESEKNPACKNYPASQGTIIHNNKGKYTAIPATPRGLNWISEKHPCVTTALGRQGSSSEFLSSCRAIGGVRRLTPIEVERLFNLPDGYTQYGIDEKGNKKEMKDGARYKALGNSFLWKKIEYILKHRINKDI